MSEEQKLIRPNYIEDCIRGELGDVDVQLISIGDVHSWRIFPNMNLLPGHYQDLQVAAVDFDAPDDDVFRASIKEKVKAIKDTFARGV